MAPNPTGAILRLGSPLPGYQAILIISEICACCRSPQRLFVSYGGSSLLTSFMAVLLLIHISNREDEPMPLAAPSKPYLW